MTDAERCTMLSMQLDELREKLGATHNLMVKMREERDVANREWATESKRSLALGQRITTLETAIGTKMVCSACQSCQKCFDTLNATLLAGDGGG